MRMLELKVESLILPVNPPITQILLMLKKIILDGVFFFSMPHPYQNSPQRFFFFVGLTTFETLIEV